MKTYKIGVAATSVISLLFVLTSLSRAMEMHHAYRQYAHSAGDRLRDAAQNGDMAQMRRLIARGANVNSKDYEGWTPLISATIGDQPEAMRFLLANGADVNARDNNGRTALYWAAVDSYKDVLALLLDHGADTEIRNSKTGLTPLIMASRQGHKGIVKLLLAKGANPGATTRNGHTALDVALLWKNNRLVRTLVAAGVKCDPEIRARYAAVLQSAGTHENNDSTRIVERSGDGHGFQIAVRQAAAVVHGQDHNDGFKRVQVWKRTAPSYESTLGHRQSSIPNIEDSGMKSTLRSRYKHHPQPFSQIMERKERGQLLLRQALAVWNRIRVEFPTVAQDIQKRVNIRQLHRLMNVAIQEPQR